ncbi:MULTISPECIES: RNA degradosome polyphosphate kinase [unclassified Nitratiruptor]|uniref:RNA degradosome polyphosphate kinase n=1 Tax=unclassified Nitratiruptor TaxID=2624044 RepID=UPI0019160154|nr:MULTISPECIES: RNA degradosome polyphosphate kinase [unclassified Nitratiruptor]BCD59662.1 polyphosphate kinase [Nitratiruptor sp. YY08-10]BCD63586.1 polyphosphate kinase [Nitratiruptor sp. YY08-14]
MNLKDPKLYINRELSWLKFNTRVLEEAQDTNNPLLERLKFIAIYGTNLDEFYMIRVAGLKKLYKYRILETGPDKMTPLEQLQAIRNYLHTEKKSLENTFYEIINALKKEGLHLKNYSALSSEEQKEIDKFFYSNLYPVIIPIAVDATHPFPHLNNLSFALALKLADANNPNDIKYGLVRIPRVLPRFVQLGEATYIPIESIVQAHINSLFPGYNALASTPFRVTRNADIEIEEEEADDFMELLEEGLKLRRKGEIVRLEIGANADEDLVAFLNEHLHIHGEDIYRYSIPLNLAGLWEIVSNKNFPHLLFEPYTPKILPPLDSGEPIFSIIDHEDVMLYHPYESFDPVVKFISEASKDPNVLAIRMTLYRVGKNSPIVKALIDAAESGKQVTAMVELKARFDEENNLIWARELEKAGAHVIFGIPGFKVHAKIAQVIKKDGDRLRQYVHLATGNYNPQTAKIYTDVSLFTAQKAVVDDATKFFHFLTGFSKKTKLSTLYMSPYQIKPKLLQMIEEEAKRGQEGHIVAKMNSLVDPDIIVALYKASMAGTKIDLIVRGICCLRPGIEGISENIQVISIVGKYLEHARIFYFRHAKPQVFISSADWMPRNLERRIELMSPIFDQDIAERLIEILNIQLKDNVKARILQSDGNYIKKTPEPNKPPIDSQRLMEEYAKLLHSTHQKNSTSKAKRLARRLLKES